MNNYTPTSAQIRESVTNYKNTTWTAAEFDRWLAAHDAELSRQSPASTTAADAWDEGASAVKAIVYQYEYGEPNPVNPYRVAAPEGDGGNE